MPSSDMKCLYCEYMSNKKYLLVRHMRSHSDERPFTCDLEGCQRAFKTAASLQNHINTHGGIKPHLCRFEGCGMAFTTSGELVRHARYKHTHEKPHKCLFPDCRYESVELSKLKRHARSHTGERPFKCLHCDYASPDTYKLKRHLRVHTGEKPYSCDICQQRFTQSNSMKAHRLIHENNKARFSCSSCSMSFLRKGELRSHIAAMHAVDEPVLCPTCMKSFPDKCLFNVHRRASATCGPALQALERGSQRQRSSRRGPQAGLSAIRHAALNVCCGLSERDGSDMDAKRASLLEKIAGRLLDKSEDVDSSDVTAESETCQQQIPVPEATCGAQSVADNDAERRQDGLHTPASAESSAVSEALTSGSVAKEEAATARRSKKRSSATQKREEATKKAKRGGTAARPGRQTGPSFSETTVATRLTRTNPRTRSTT